MIIIALPLILALSGLAFFLLEVAARGDPTSARLRVDNLRTAATAAAGLVGICILLLTFHRQWVQEREVNATDHDARERRITELFTKASDQLGSDKAVVRLAGLYALERLAQDYPTQRQPIVNLICAYLQIRYNPAPWLLADSNGLDSHGVQSDNQEGLASELDTTGEEWRVRTAAEAILANHLRLKSERGEKNQGFWRDIRVDLSNATLLEARFSGCHFRRANFRGVRFLQDAWFRGAAFLERADFSEANFAQNANFASVRFAQEANFGDSVFEKDADFTATIFGFNTWFGKAVFKEIAFFARSKFGPGGWTIGNLHMRSPAFENARASFATRAHPLASFTKNAQDLASTWPEGWRLVPDPEGGLGWLKRDEGYQYWVRVEVEPEQPEDKIESTSGSSNASE